jgi:pimeloyl-ACP methyl ester carboxylesterase
LIFIIDFYLFFETNIIRIPQTRAMVIHGRNDLVLPLSAGEHLHESLKKSELHVISETSHQVFQENPDKVASLLLEFVRGK